MTSSVCRDHRHPGDGDRLRIACRCSWPVRRRRPARPQRIRRVRPQLHRRTTPARLRESQRASALPWGDPDLQGVWNDATSTPLQRPSGVGSKDVLSDEEAAEFQDQTGQPIEPRPPRRGAEVDVNRAYNEHWMDSRRLKTTADHRTSLIVDPPDGRIPPLVPVSPERQKQRDERAAAANGPFQRGPARTLTWISLCPCAASFGPTRRRTCRPSTTTIFRFSRVPDTWSSLPR